VPDKISFTLNGVARESAASEHTPILYVLRNDLGVKSPRYGCGAEQCGSCMVLVDGKVAYACTTQFASVRGCAITTVEGLGTESKPHALQRALLDEQAAQCGYCLPGILMRAAALLAETPRPDEAAVRKALDGNLCRCGAHNRIVRAVLRAASETVA
jgi:nicotinate dehydrogenase subunit A